MAHIHAFGTAIDLTSTGSMRPASLASALEAAAPYLHCVRVTRTDHVAQETLAPVSEVVRLLRGSRRPRLSLDAVDGGHLIECVWAGEPEYALRTPEAEARHRARQQWPQLQGPRAWVDAAERARCRFAGVAPSSAGVRPAEWLRRHLSLLVAGDDPLEVLLACGERIPHRL